MCVNSIKSTFIFYSLLLLSIKLLCNKKKHLTKVIKTSQYFSVEYPQSITWTFQCAWGFSKLSSTLFVIIIPPFSFLSFIDFHFLLHFPFVFLAHLQIQSYTQMLINPTIKPFFLLMHVRTLIHTEKQRYEYISRCVIDVNNLDRCAESAFSSHISVQVPYKEITHIKYAAKQNFSDPLWQVQTIEKKVLHLIGQ